jgi:hypothetical protein
MLAANFSRPGRAQRHSVCERSVELLAQLRQGFDSPGRVTGDLCRLRVRPEGIRPEANRSAGQVQLRQSEREAMSKLRVTITISLDGYVAGPDQSEQDPLGVGGEQLHEWLIALQAFQETHGGEQAGEVNASTPIAEGILGGSAPRSWAGTCSAVGRARGGRTGRATGETSRLTTTRSSS